MNKSLNSSTSLRVRLLCLVLSFLMVFQLFQTVVFANVAADDQTSGQNSYSTGEIGGEETQTVEAEAPAVVQQPGAVSPEGGESPTMPDELPLNAPEDGGPLGAPGEGGVDQGLIAILTPVTTGEKTGAFNNFRLDTSLSSTDIAEYADITLSLTNLPAGSTFPDFPSDKYIIESNGSNFTLRLTRDLSGEPISITYRLMAGEEFTAFIKVKVPNGTSSNPTDVTFDAPTFTNTFTGNTQVSGTSLQWVANFGWQNVKQTASPSRLTVADGAAAGTLVLSGPITYITTCRNAMAGASSGAIFTAWYTLTDTLTLPAGVSFPSGTGSLSADGLHYSIGGKVVATFSKPVQSCSVSGNTLTYEYRVDNSTLDANGDAAAGKTAADLENLSLTTTLNGPELLVNMDTFVEESTIQSEVSFTAHPCKQVATDSESDDAVSTPIYDTLPSFYFEKSNEPANSVVISDRETYIQYTLSVKNTSIRTQTVTVSDTIPTGLDYATDAAHQPTPGFAMEDGTISWNVVLAPKEEQSFIFFTQVAEGTADGTTLSNRGQISSESGYDGWSNTVSNTYDSKDHLLLNKSVVSTTNAVTGNTKPYPQGMDVFTGDTVKYKIAVTNLSGSKDSDPYTITDTLPNGVTLSAAQEAALGAAYPGAHYTKATGIITIPLPSVPHNNAANPTVFIFDATVTGSIPTGEFADNVAVVNTAEIKDLHLKSTANVRYVTPVERLALAKSAGVTRVTKGDVIPYTITITNNSTVVQPHNVTDTLPAGVYMTSAQVLELQAAYPGTLFETVDGITTITIPNVTVDVDAVKTIKFNATVTGDDFLPDQAIVNTVEIRDVENLKATATVRYKSLVTIAKKADRSTATHGNTIVWTVTLTNNSQTTDAMNQTITDTLPVGVNLTDAQMTELKNRYPGASFNDETRVLTIPGVNIPAKGSTEVSFSTTVDGDGKAAGEQMINTATVNKETATAKVVYTAQFTMAKTADRTTATVDDIIVWTVTMGNASQTVEAQNQSMTDTLPAGVYMTTAQVTALQATYPTAVYDDETRVITITGITIPANGQAVIKIPTTVDGTGLVDNDRLTNRAQGDNLNGSATVVFREKRAVVSSGKTAGKPAIVGEQLYQIPYVIKITNQGVETDGLTKPLKFSDTMTGGLYPVGAGNATEGTVTGIDSKGHSVTGTWVRAGASAPYSYTVTWDIPVLAPGETYTISYKGEIKGSLTETVTARNSVTVTGSVTGKPGGGTTTPIRPTNSLTKVIADVDGKAPANNKSSVVYPGQKVTYTVTLDNNSESIQTIGTVRDTLPPIAVGSPFQWIYNTNVHITGDATDGAAIENGTLVWSGVTLEAGTSKTWTITLDYPLASQFQKAFGSMPAATSNVVTYVSSDGFISLRDSVTHTMNTQRLDLSKSVDREIIDAAVATGDERVATWTLSGFGTQYPAENLSLLDNLDNVRNRFEIDTIYAGNFTVLDYTTGLQRGYTLTLTFADTTTLNVNVGVDNVVNFTWPTGKSFADVAAVRWNFGNVKSLTVNTDPTITTTVKGTAYPGKAVNRAFLYYDGRSVVKEASVLVKNGNMLAKRLLHSDGTYVNNDEDCATIGEKLTFEVVYTNLLSDGYDMTGVSMEDTIAAAGLDSTKDLLVTVKHTSINGKVTDPVKFANGTNKIAVPASDWSDGSFTLTFASGTMALSDALTLTYEVTTSPDFKTSAENDNFALRNEMAVHFVNGDEDISAECGPYRAERAIYLRLQKSIVGYNGWGYYSNANEDEPYGTVGDIVTEDLSKAPAIGSAYSGGVGILYNIALVNSEKSSVSFTAPSGFTLSDISNHRMDESWDFVFLTGFNASSSGQTSTSSADAAALHAAGMLKYTGQNGETYTSVGLDSWTKVEATSTTSPVTYKTSGFTLAPGQSTGFVVELQNAFNSMTSSTELLDHVENTISMKIRDSINVPAGTKIYLDDTELDCPTFDNKTTSRTDFENSRFDSYNGECTYNGPTRTFSSTVSVEQEKPSIAIKKETVGFITPSDFQSTARPATPLPTGTKAASFAYQVYKKWKWGSGSINSIIRDPYLEPPGPSDYICWVVEVKNTGTTTLSHYQLEDIVPYPYEIGGFCWIYNTPAMEGYVSIVSDLMANASASGNFITNYTEPSGNPSYDKTSVNYNVRHYLPAPSGTSPQSLVIPYTGFTEYECTPLAPGASLYLSIIAKPRAGAKVQFTTYTNRAQVTEKPGTHFGSVTEGTVLYNGAEATADVSIGGRFGTKSYKSVTNADGLTATNRNKPNYVPVDTYEEFTYTLDVQSLSTTSYLNFVLIDRLPTSGDSGAVNVQSKRGSQFDVSLAADPAFTVKVDTGSGYQDIPAENYKIEFKNYQGASSTFSTQDWAGTNTWDGQAASADAFRIRLINYNLEPSAKLRVTFKAKLTSPTSVSTGQIAWNTFGYRYDAYNSDINDYSSVIAEPPKVGVMIPGAYISVLKHDNASLPLAQAVFTIYRYRNETTGALSSPVGTITTGADGKGTSLLLAKQKYYVKETTAPEHYLPSGEVYEVDLSTAATNAKVPINNGVAVINYPDDINIWMTLRKTFAETAILPTEDTVTLYVSGDFTYGTANVPVTFSRQEWETGTGKDIGDLVPGNVYTITEEGSDYTFTMTATNDADDTNIAVAGSQFKPVGDCTVSVVNDSPQPGELRIKKVVNGKDGGETFTVRVEGKFTDSLLNYKDFTFTSAQRDKWVTVPGVSFGESYQIYERFVPVAYKVSYTATSVLMDAAGKDIVVTNTSNPPAVLRLTKTVDGVKPTEGAFSVLVSGSFSDTPNPSKTITLNSANGWTANVSGVKVGESYTIQEQLTGDDLETYSPSYTGLDDNNQVPIPAASVLSVVAVTINNAKTTGHGSFALTKGLDGAASEDVSFTFTLVGPAGEPEEATYTGSVTIPANSTEELVTWKKGTDDADMTMLPYGEYTLKETSLAENFSFVHFELGNAVSESTNEAGLTFTLDKNNKHVLAKVQNREQLGQFELTKHLAQPAEADTTFNFTLVGPGTGADAKTYTGALLVPEGTSDSTVVTWKLGEEEADMSRLPIGSYVLTEDLTGNSDYLFNSFVVNGSATPSTDNPITISIADGTTVSVVANNSLNFGELTLSKKVSGVYGQYNRKFTFTIVLTDAENAAISGSFAYTGGVLTGQSADKKPADGNITFNAQGSGTIQLSHGQTITLSLPQGAKYTITEEDLTDEGYVVTKTGNTGTIGSTAATSAWENARDVTPPTGIILDVFPFVIMVALAVVSGIIFFLRKRRKVRSDAQGL